jgi:ABC-type glycerol-3-phosphate transport system substrate-binding protein
MISSYPDPVAENNGFERFRQRDALIIMNSSQQADQIRMKANRTGRPDNWIMIPFPGLDGHLAVNSQVQSGIIFESSPEYELASWLFLKYLASPETQAEWVKYSESYPTREDTRWLLSDYAADHPNWAQGLDLLTYGKPDPLHPSWIMVKQVVGDAFEELYWNNLSEAITLLRTLDQTASELVDYDQGR